MYENAKTVSSSCANQRIGSVIEMQGFLGFPLFTREFLV
jgi:hypothetical protein